VTPPAALSSGKTGATVTCTACPLLCEDIRIDAGRCHQACDRGATALLTALAAAGDGMPAAWENGGAVDLAVAIARAAELLSAARRPLVTGLPAATLESIAAACDIAETLGAAVDGGLPESFRSAGPTIARAGEVTAAWEELRDRADLVLFWCCDPDTTHPRFRERFVAPPTAAGGRRRCLTVGPAAGPHDGPDHVHLPLDRGRGLEAARCLHLLLGGRHLPSSTDPRLAALCGSLLTAIRAAGCVAVVTDVGDDAVGLEAWSIVHLVRTIAHERPAFEVPLATGPTGGGPDAAGAAAVCTWRYGAAGAIARADRTGSLFLPAESDAGRLVARGEVDVVLVLGSAGDAVERVLADRAAAIATVRICDAPAATGAVTGRTIQLRCASGLTGTSGTMLRGDGRLVTLRPCRPGVGRGMHDLLDAVHRAVRVDRDAAAGGRP